MTSNFLGAYPTEEVTRRKKGSKDKESVACPAMVKHYNMYMTGVDIMDQKEAAHQYDHRSIPGGRGRWGRVPPPPPLKYKLIYISSQRNSGNRTSEDATARSSFVFVLSSLDFLGGKLDDKRREELFFFGFHRYFQWNRKQKIVPPPLFKFLDTPLHP